MRTWLILLSALAFTACSGDGDKDGTTDDTGPTTGDDDDDDDTADPVDAILALTGDAGAGATVYGDNCEFCHGATGEGGTGLPLNVALDPATVVETIYYGAGIMSEYGTVLSEQEIADAAAHVATFAP